MDVEAIPYPRPKRIARFCTAAREYAMHDTFEIREPTLNPKALNP
jgi:hypothetical protein